MAEVAVNKAVESALASVTAAVAEAAKAAVAAAAESAVASVTAVAEAAKAAMTAAAESVEPMAPVEHVEPMAPVEPMEHLEPVHTTATTATVYAVKKAVIMTFLIDNSPTSTYNRKHFSEMGGLVTSGVCDHPFSDLCGNGTGGKDDIKYTGNRTGASGKREFWLLVPEVCKLLTEFKFLKKDIIIAKIRELWQLTQTDVQLSDEIKAILNILVSRANILLQDCRNELVDDSLRSELVICASDLVNMAKTILHGNVCDPHSMYQNLVSRCCSMANLHDRILHPHQYPKVKSSGVAGHKRLRVHHVQKL
jgi:hypothetical protein